MAQQPRPGRLARHCRMRMRRVGRRRTAQPAV